MWEPSLFLRCHFRRLLFSNVGGVKLSAPELLRKQTGKALPTGNFLINYAKSARQRPSTSESRSDAVKIADASNFDSAVTNSGRDAFILFYKPTCRHCLRLMPTWEELGEKMKNENVDIIKMDAISNHVPRPYVVNGYPTMYLKFASPTKTPLKYGGDRDIESFIRYLSRNVSNELLGWDRWGHSKKINIK